MPDKNERRVKQKEKKYGYVSAWVNDIMGPKCSHHHPADILRRGSGRQRGHDEIRLQSNRLFAKKLLRNVNQNVMPSSAGGVSSPTQSASRGKKEK